MSFLDGLLNDAKTQLGNVQADVQKYLTTKIQEPLVKIGVLPTGNLNQAQLNAGLRGTPPPIVPPAAPPVTIARSEGSGASTNTSLSLPAGMSVPILVGLGLVAFLVFKKKG